MTKTKLDAFHELSQFLSNVVEYILRSIERRSLVPVDYMRSQNMPKIQQLINVITGPNDPKDEIIKVQPTKILKIKNQAVNVARSVYDARKKDPPMQVAYDHAAEYLSIQIRICDYVLNNK